MKLLPLTIQCPKCGSEAVAYSCEPDCCFNHVCEECLTNFQLVTRDLGGRVRGLDGARPEAQKDSCAPTTVCARCGSLDIWKIEDLAAGEAMRVTCLSCEAMLEIGIE